MKNCNGGKPELENLSKVARLKYIRELRYLKKDYVADYFELGGERKKRTISRYENNSRVPNKERLIELVNLYDVSINAIKEYKYDNLINVIYMFMWLEEQFPYYEINFDNVNIKYNLYNMNIQKRFSGVEENERKNGEISTAEYIEWKLNYEIN